MRCLSFILAACILMGCGSASPPVKEQLLGSWRLQDISVPGSADAFGADAELKKTVRDGVLLSLFADGTYTQVKGTGEYVWGKWSTDEKKLRFVRSDGYTETIPMGLRKRGEQQQLVVRDKSQTAVIKFMKEALPLETVTNDPFHPSNNTWRIRAAAPETPEQLKLRLANYFRHFACNLKAAKDRKQQAVYFGFSQGPIKVYSGAIGIHPYEIVPDSWKQSFYDEGDAAEAYRAYQQLLRTTSYNGASSGNWIEDDYNILESMYVEVRKGRNIEQETRKGE